MYLLFKNKRAHSGAMDVTLELRHNYFVTCHPQIDSPSTAQQIMIREINNQHSTFNSFAEH